MTSDEVFWALREKDPLLFDTFSFLVRLALESNLKLDEHSLFYVRNWIRYFELFFELDVNWKGQAEGLDLSSELQFFASLESDDPLPDAKPDEISSNVGWHGLKLFKNDLRNTTRYWTQLRGVMTKKKEAYRQQLPPRKRWLQDFGVGGMYGLTLEDMQGEVKPEVRHKDPLLVPLFQVCVS